MKKRVLAVLLTATMCFSIAACGKDDSRRDRDRDDEDEVETEVVETEEGPSVATTTEDEHERETRETTETTVDNTLAYDPESQSDYGVSIHPLATYDNWSSSGGSEIQTRLANYYSENGIEGDIFDAICWIPEGNEVSQYPMQFTIDGDEAYDNYWYFSTDSYNLIFDCSYEMCLIVGTDDSIPTLTELYDSSDGSMTIDEMIENGYGGIIVPEYVNRNDSDRIDAELADVDPNAHIVEYNPNGFPNYSIIPIHDIFETPGVYYIRCYILDDSGEWHTTCNMAQFNNGIASVAVIDFVAEGIDDDYCYD